MSKIIDEDLTPEVMAFLEKSYPESRVVIFVFTPLQEEPEFCQVNVASNFADRLEMVQTVADYLTVLTVAEAITTIPPTSNTLN